MTPQEASKKQEERIAKLFNTTPTPRSGGGNWKKGDVLSENYLIECKTSVTPKLTYSVKKLDLDKAKHEARQMRKENSILSFTIGENFEDYFIVDTKFIKDYLGYKKQIKDLYEQTVSELSQVEFTAQQLTEQSRAGYEITELEKASYQIHKSRLTHFIEKLKRFL